MPIHSALLTDFYQLTMAYGYWQLQRAETPAVFQLTFRTHPFQNNYTIACGLASVIDYLKNYQFSKTDLQYLKSLRYANKKPIFAPKFLHYLSTLKFSCDIEAIPEGSVVFPQEPLLRIRGPLLQCQLLETTLLNLLNLPTLVATRAAQICQLTGGDEVMEFGLRRAQGPDGGLTASRAAYVGGCTSTSNVLAGQQFNIPVKGTMAHSWVLSYPDEYSAFLDFVNTNATSILLVDTYDSVHGIQNAIKVGEMLRQQQRPLLAIRLDSGDLLELSKKARKMLDQAGFKDTQIIASGDLTVEKIAYLKSKRAPIDAWGVGTKLVTAYEQPALDMIYKLTAIANAKNQFIYKMKLSDSPSKMTYPGILQVRRFYQKQIPVQDVVYMQDTSIKNTKESKDLLVPIFRKGKLVYKSPALADIRAHCLQQVNAFAQAKKSYPVIIDSQLQDMIREIQLQL